MKLPGKKAKGLLLVIAAVVCGFLAMGIVFILARQVAPSVPVLKASQEIKIGQKLTKEMFSTIKIAKTDVMPDLVSPETDLSAYVARKTISEGDILRGPAIIDLNSKTPPALLSTRLKLQNNPSLRAAEIPAETAKGLLPGMDIGDSIDIITVYPVESEDGRNTELVSETIITDVLVIGVRVGDQERIEEQPTVLIVALTSEEAETLALYKEKGKIYPVLRPLGQYGNIKNNQHKTPKQEIQNTPKDLTPSKS